MHRPPASRPVFHTQADYQHAFAWEAHQLRSDLGVRLERRLSAETNDLLDLLFIGAEATIAVELKDPVTKFDAAVEVAVPLPGAAATGEPLILRAQSTEDRTRLAYVWDLGARVGGWSSAASPTLASLCCSPTSRSLAAAAAARAVSRPIPSSGCTRDASCRGRSGSGTAPWWRKEKLPETVYLTGCYRSPRVRDPQRGRRGGSRWTAAVVQTLARDRSLGSESRAVWLARSRSVRARGRGVSRGCRSRKKRSRRGL